MFDSQELVNATTELTFIHTYREMKFTKASTYSDTHLGRGQNNRIQRALLWWECAFYTAFPIVLEASLAGLGNVYYIKRLLRTGLSVCSSFLDISIDLTVIYFATITLNNHTFMPNKTPLSLMTCLTSLSDMCRNTWYYLEPNIASTGNGGFHDLAEGHCAIPVQ